MKKIRTGGESETPAVALRRRAEGIARGKAFRIPENTESLSIEAAGQMLHELRVHQIELEMQNEDLRRTQGELEASRAQYFDLYNLAPVGYFTLSEKGLILEANLNACTLLSVASNVPVKQPLTRFILKEDQDIYYLYRKQLFERHATFDKLGQASEQQACELRMVRKDGTLFWAHLEAIAVLDATGAPVYHVVISDITERKSQEDERDLTERLTLLVDTPGDFCERMSDLTASLQDWSGCEAVGIRLRAGDDYPYYQTSGFPATFVQAENHICAYDLDGNILRNDTGKPVLKCMCGHILCGRFDPAKPFFTAHGSFWSNNTTALFASTTEADRQARTRWRCSSEGYKSVALIPLRISDQVFGLLQFNDHRPDRFTLAQIAHFERMADSLAIALSRRQDAESIKNTLVNLRKAVSTTIQVMASAVETRDPCTAGHQFRSADLARAIATEMELPAEKIEGIFMAGSIHDIGKLSIPAEILAKPGKLHEIEFSLIKEHARQGYEILKEVESPWPLAEIVYQHHERTDGSGYPRNLKGDEILMEARILAVADVVESMASHRPYRATMGIDAALDEIEKNSGIFYDKTVADACLRLFREKGFQLAEKSPEMVGEREAG